MCKVLQCHQNQESCSKVLSSLVQLLTELPLNLWSNTAMPYEPITSSISMWADADTSAGNSQDSLGTWTTAVLFHQWESRKVDIHCSTGGLRNIPPTNICFSNPFNKILPRQGRLSTGMTGQTAGPFVWESCLLWSGPDASEGGTAQVVNNDVIPPKGKFLPDLIN